jgi:quercetin dioxygenase-like cupin family protein
MDTVNAIAKVRFASAKPQRVQLRKNDEGPGIEMLCLEPDQEVSVRNGQWAYYVITGSATLEVGDQQSPLATGHVAVSAPGEKHKLVNASETRLICLAVEVGS